MIKLPNYEISECLHQGQKTTVYRGIRIGDNCPVILKTPTSEYPSLKDIARLKHEYELLMGFQAEGVIRAYDMERLHSRQVLVLEDIQGSTIKYALSNASHELDNFLQIAIQVANTLGRIHQANLIHKDINPSNIIMNPETKQVQVIDFGISSRLSRENTKISSPDLLEGTLAYISPEQTGRMNRAIDYRTDFYSLGATFYEMLSGRSLFPVGDPMEQVHSHIAKHPTPLHEVNADIPIMLSKIIMKLLSKTAEDRYQGAYGLREDLEKCLEHWQHHGSINGFPIAERDISSVFQIPQKLYGREEEWEVLLDAFNRVSQGSTEMMLVAGYSGVGKSALVNEINKPIVRERGYFVSGKFDQFKRNIPYSSIIQAFQSLIQQILTESKQRIEQWKEKLVPALGANGQLIIDVIPEAEWIVGKQPPVPELPPTESQNRFRIVFQNFINVFATEDHPLALFLDDLQWADTPSLNLIKSVMTSESRYFFFIGAYRDNEVSAAHPLMLALEELEKKKRAVHTIRLKPLNSEHVTQLIQESLHCSSKDAHELGAVVHRKTHGNPFFVNAFLRSLYEEKILEFDINQGWWTWELEKIRELKTTDNVVDLMLGKMQKLSPNTQQILKLAACVGNQFDLRTLAIVHEKSQRQTSMDLWEAVNEGMIQPVGQDYKMAGVAEEEHRETEAGLEIVYQFPHDRVQQAAYSLISDDHKQEIHLRIGRLMLKNVDKHQLEESFFEIVNHLNTGIPLIDDLQERADLVELNTHVGKKAKDSAAYQSALQYWETGLQLLPDDVWESNYRLVFDLSLQKAECEFLVGNYEQAETQMNQLLDRAQSTVDKVEVYKQLQICSTGQSKYEETMKIGIVGLKLCDIDLPLHPTAEEVGAELALAEENLAGRPVAALLDGPRMDDPIKGLAMRLLVEMWAPTYIAGNDSLLALCTVRMANISMQYGHIPESAFAYGAFGMLLTAGLNQVDRGYEFGKLSLTLDEKLEDLSQRSRLHQMFGCLNAHWKVHIRECEYHTKATYEYGLQTGDLNFATYGACHILCQSWGRGDTLEQVMTNFNRFFPMIEKSEDPVPTLFFKLYQLGAFGLMERELTFTDSHILNETSDLENQHICNVYHTIKAQQLFLYGRHEEGKIASEKAKETAYASVGNPLLVDQPFYYSLHLIALYPDADESTQNEYLEIVRANQEQMKNWVDNCAQNVLHKYKLVAAEEARLQGKTNEAIALYDQAIHLAQENEFLQVEALANELAARFYLVHNPDSVSSGILARHYMQTARYEYLRWGATLKAEQIERDYPQLMVSFGSKGKSDFTATVSSTMSVGSFSLDSTSDSTSSLDVNTVTKASQALAEEIVFDQLLSKMIKITIENAGAQKGYLILGQEGSWKIEAAGDVNSEETTVRQALPFEECQDLSQGVVHYVIRTQKSVVMHDAVQEGRFKEDAYILQKQPKSVLCAPIFHQGKLDGIVYLENNLTTGAFTENRLEMVKVLASQMAISIENARLYASLQDALEHEIELNTSFARFVPHEFLGLLGKESILDVQLGDHQQMDMSVLFSDIRSFTSLSETMNPEENFRFINGYLKRMEPVISEHQGFIDKYIGDAIMALFNRNADDAVKAAIAMCMELKSYNQSRKATGYDPIQIGIGINTGRLMLGTVGGYNRMEGSVISDAVNLASRIESMTKLYGISLLIGENTYLQLQDSSHYSIRLIDRVKVRGKTQPVTIYEVCDGDSIQVRDAKMETSRLFEEAISLYYLQEFKQALTLFQECLSKSSEDNAAKNYIKRCQHLLDAGRDPNWENVTELKFK